MVGAGQEEQHREMPGDECEQNSRKQNTQRVGGEGGEGRCGNLHALLCKKSQGCCILENSCYSTVAYRCEWQISGMSQEDLSI